MSSKNNVNPDHYKTGGRARQGEHIDQEMYKREYSQSKADQGADPPNFIPGAQTAEEAGETAKPNDEGEREEGQDSAKE